MFSPPQETAFPIREQRRLSIMRAFAVHSGGDVTDATITNVSYGGCQFRCAEPVTVNDLLELKVVRRGSIQVRVVWTGVGRAGCQFIPNDGPREN